MNSEIDIVTRLRQFVRRCNHGWDLGNDWYPAPTECVSCTRQREAADEIERLRAEISRLGSFLYPIGTVINGQAVRGDK